MNNIDLQPVLKGVTLELRPLARADFEALYRAASDPAIWEMHPDSERYQREIFQSRFFEGAIASGGALVIVEGDSGRIVGSSRYYDWQPDTKEISVGYTFIERGHWGRGSNREVKDLMLQYIYQWAEVVWFHVAESNMRSRRSVEKLGAILSHEEERELDGRPFTQLYYKLDASEYRS